jgi:Icc-related predicted phosphoesterase
MRVACTADWHGYIPPEIPDCDILLVAGDIGLGETFSYEPEVLMVDWCNWLKSLSCRVVAIAGNHDFHSDLLRAMPWIYLEDEWVNVDGLKIWGSPWSNPFGYGWAFNMTEQDQEELFKEIPDDIDIIVSHGPPKGLRDTVSYFDGIRWVNKGVGSEALRNRMDELENLKLVACGHIHPQYGKKEKVVNGCLVNPSYEVANKPIVVEI